MSPLGRRRRAVTPSNLRAECPWEGASTTIGHGISIHWLGASSARIRLASLRRTRIYFATCVTIQWHTKTPMDCSLPPDRDSQSRCRTGLPTGLINLRLQVVFIRFKFQRRLSFRRSRRLTCPRFVRCLRGCEPLAGSNMDFPVRPLSNSCTRSNVYLPHIVRLPARRFSMSERMRAPFERDCSRVGR